MSRRCYPKRAAGYAMVLVTLGSGYACSSDSGSDGKDGSHAGSSNGNAGDSARAGSGNGGGSGGSSGNFGSITAQDPPFQGLGNSWRPLTTGCGPKTASECAGTCEASPDRTVDVIRPPALLCFGADGSKDSVDPTDDTPAAIIEQVIETQGGVSYVHIRVTFNPAFADNTYGANASAGWFATKEDGKAGKGHTFTDDLTGSDHLELLLTDGKGATAMDFKIDYITSLTDSGKPGGPGKAPPPPPPGTGGSPATATTTTTAATTSSCGFTTLGVLGGDGKMITGDSSAILATATSISRNVDGCGYCKSDACDAGSTGTGDGDCTVNSPVTDENLKANSDTPNWNYDVVYEAWIALSAFGDAGFGQAYITSIHASPSKLASNTLYVVPEPCPPSWGVCTKGQNCWGTSGTGGAGGSSGTGEKPCEPNYQLYITQEGATECTPIPFAGYPGYAPCPEGYQLDTASEGRYCVRTQ
ncbi:MAG: hypothetical protein QM784_05685 [Polyangiaceae bacterium]